VSPLAIDLFCGLGLGQAEFGLGANSPVEEFVTCRTKDPNHVRSGVFHLAKRAIAPVLWPVGEFHDPRFSARLTRGWKVGVFPTQPYDDTGILELPSAVVDLLNLRVLPMEGSSRLLRGLSRAVVRAIASIAVRRNDLEVLPADAAVSSGLGFIRLFIPPKSASASLTSDRTVSLVGAFSREASPAQ
jgi:hypothetical protein